MRPFVIVITPISRHYISRIFKPNFIAETLVNLRLQKGKERKENGVLSHANP